MGNVFSTGAGKSVLIIGGTGTLGKAVIRKLLRYEGHDITVISRDELKQKEFKAEFPTVKTYLGDVARYESIAPYFENKRSVFHFAAMKHVDMAEENISECIRINLLGTENVIQACKRAEVDHAVFSSTDKAVLPINAYGMCKALSEKLWLSSNEHADTHFSVFRWGNVLGSRGSVIHSFIKSLRERGEVNITHEDMTRFWIHINDAAKFIVENYEYADPQQIMIPPMKGASLLKLAEMTAFYLNIKRYKKNIIGIRPGEKMHEWLDYHDPDLEVKSNTCEQYTDEELYELIARTIRGNP